MFTREEIAEYGAIASQAYDIPKGETEGDFVPIPQLEIEGNNENLGFSAGAHFNHETGELVISFGGTELPLVDPDDLNQDAVLALTNRTHQDQFISPYVQDVLDHAADQGWSVAEITYTGHSLGGYLAQQALLSDTSGNAKAIVFNSTGHPSSVDDAPVTYYYTEPRNWSFDSAPIHELDTRLSDEVYFVVDESTDYSGLFDSHFLGPLLTAVQNGNQILDSEQYAEHLASHLESIWDQVKDSQFATMAMNLAINSGLSFVPEELLLEALSMTNIPGDDPNFGHVNISADSISVHHSNNPADQAGAAYQVLEVQIDPNTSATIQTFAPNGQIDSLTQSELEGQIATTTVVQNPGGSLQTTEFIQDGELVERVVIDRASNGAVNSQSTTTFSDSPGGETDTRTVEERSDGTETTTDVRHLPTGGEETVVHVARQDGTRTTTTTVTDAFGEVVVETEVDRTPSPGGGTDTVTSVADQSGRIETTEIVNLPSGGHFERVTVTDSAGNTISEGFSEFDSGGNAIPAGSSGEGFDNSTTGGGFGSSDLGYGSPGAGSTPSYGGNEDDGGHNVGENGFGVDNSSGDSGSGGTSYPDYDPPSYSGGSGGTSYPDYDPPSYSGGSGGTSYPDYNPPSNSGGSSGTSYPDYNPPSNSSGSSTSTGEQTAYGNSGGQGAYGTDSNDPRSGFPVVLDLDGDGVELNFNQQIHFDWDNDGLLERTGWVGADDGLLAVDLNSDGSIGQGDGRIDQASEIAFASLVSWARTDLHALRAFDFDWLDLDGDGTLESLGGNGDGVLSAGDDIWAALRIWQDIDQDGIADDGEVRSLSDWGITEVSLSYEGVGDETATRFGHAGADFSDTSNDLNFFGNTVHGLGSFTINGQTRASGLADVSFVYYDTTLAAPGRSLIGTGADDILLGQQAGDYLSGAAGNDTLTGFGGADYLFGGAGRDTMSGGDGDDILSGGEGNDDLSGSDGFDALDGGTGSDILRGGNDGDRFILSGTFGADTITDFRPNEGDQIVLRDVSGVTRYADIWPNATQVGNAVVIDLGTSGSLTLNNFTIAEMRGDHFTFEGGIAADGNQSSGNGNTSGGSQSSNTGTSVTHDGTSGSDTLQGSEGDDIIAAGSGDDSIWGRDGDDTLLGQAGNDDLSGSDGSDTLDGGIGSDILRGGNDGDRFILSGAFGADTITDFRPDEGDQIVFQGVSGVTRYADVWPNATQVGTAVVITLGASGSITLNNFALADLRGDHFVFEEADEAQPGAGASGTSETGAPNVIEDAVGRQTLDGTAAADTFVMSQDADKDDITNFVEGQDQIDLTAWGATGLDDARLSLRHDGDHTLILFTDGDFSDRIELRYVNIDLTAATNFVFSDETGTSTPLPSNESADSSEDGPNSSSITGTAGTDTITGTSDADQITAGAGNDGIWAREGDDVVLGQAGDDDLSGGDGADTLDGGAGADILRGGSGGDRFVLSGIFGADTIADFRPDEGDQIVLRGVSGVTRYADIWPNATQVGAAVVIDLGAMGTLTINNFTIADMRGDHFMFEGETADPSEAPPINLEDEPETGGTSNQIIDVAGRSTLTGTSEVDTFVMQRDGDKDDINNFTEGADRIDLTAWGVTGLDDTRLDIRHDGDHTLIIFTDGDFSDRIELRSVNINETNPSNFIFTDEALEGGPDGDPDTEAGTDVNTVAGTSGDDPLTGTQNADRIAAGAGNDGIWARDGDDELFGEAGDDDLSGGEGADHLDGGAGADILRGGAGGDRVGLSGGFGSDTVADFRPGEGDAIVFAGVSGVTRYADVWPNATQVGANVVIDFGASGSLTISNFTIAEMRGDHFSFEEASAASPEDTSGGGDTTTTSTTNQILDDAGRSTLTGTAEADVFVMQRDGDKDDIIGFTEDQDRIDISAWGATGLNDARLTLRHDGPSTKVSFNDGGFSDIFEMAGINMDLTDADNFIFADDDASGSNSSSSHINQILDVSGRTTLTGTSGADVFVMTSDGDKDDVFHFTEGHDRVDLTAWGVNGLDDARFDLRHDGAHTIGIFDDGTFTDRFEMRDVTLSYTDADNFIFG